MKKPSFLGVMIIILLGFGVQLAVADDNNSEAVSESKQTQVQDKVFEIEVVNEVSMNKEEMAANMEAWFTDQHWKTPTNNLQKILTNQKQEEIIEVSIFNRDIGLIMGKGVKWLDVDTVFGARTPFHYKFKINYKDGKYRYTINEVRTSPSGGQPITDYEMDKQDKARKEFLELIDSFQLFLKKNADF